MQISKKLKKKIPLLKLRRDINITRGMGDTE